MLNNYSRKMNIIYLDIDGVMNAPYGSNDEHESDMQISKLKLLKDMIRDLDFDGIVITSSRRSSDIDLKNKTNAFEKYGIHVLGAIRNPNDNIDDNRAKQILDHYNENKELIKSFVIIDDTDDHLSEVFNSKFVYLLHFYGLRKEDRMRIMQALNK